MQSNKLRFLTEKLRSRPNAIAVITGNPQYPDILGKVLFYNTPLGVLVCCDVMGLPYSKNNCGAGVFGIHIHEGESCTGNENDYFYDTLGHYNPYRCEHPKHAGDMPPLFENAGYAFSCFLTTRFVIEDIISRTVVIHRNADDFTTQPSGNSGEKIACGDINIIK